MHFKIIKSFFFLNPYFINLILDPTSRNWDPWFWFKCWSLIQHYWLLEPESSIDAEMSIPYCWLCSSSYISQLGTCHLVHLHLLSTTLPIFSLWKKENCRWVFCRVDGKKGGEFCDWGHKKSRLRFFLSNGSHAPKRGSHFRGSQTHGSLVKVDPRSW